MIDENKLFLKMEVTVLRFLYLLSHGSSKMSVTRVLWVFDDVSFLFEAVLPADSSGGEVISVIDLAMTTTFWVLGHSSYRSEP